MTKLSLFKNMDLALGCAAPIAPKQERQERKNRMPRFSSKTSAAVVLGALLLCGSALSPLHAGDQIPFKGYIIVTGEPVGEPTFPFLAVRFTGPGRSTLLGNVTVEATGTLNLLTLEYTGSAVWTVSN